MGRYTPLFITMVFLSIISFAVVLVLVLPENAEADTIYVNATNPGTQNGQRWETAYSNLQEALANASPPCEIWVAAGTYTPTPPGQPSTRTDSFAMKNVVGIYGGFSGTETALNQRNWKANLTILSGEILNPGTPDNCYHVFYNSGDTVLDSTAILDGFTITGGNANGEYFPNNAGGGMYIGSLNRNGGPSGSPTLTNCTFSDNSAQWGGGLFNKHSSPKIANCAFFDNLATGEYFGEGGAIANWFDSSPAIINCTFSSNSADNWGGAVFNHHYSLATMVNNTFFENTADEGSGVYNWFASSVITNCILWNGIADEIRNQYNGSATVEWSDVQGGYTGIGNINANPMLVNPSSGDFHLLPSSSCIDGGSNSAIQTAGIDKDFEGDDRIRYVSVDMGADESPYDMSILITDPTNPISTGSAILNGTLNHMGGAGALDVYFQWNFGPGEPYAYRTGTQTMTIPGTFSAKITGLEDSQTYYFRAAVAGDIYGYSTEESFTCENIVETVYVDIACTGTPTGQSWEQAYTDLQEAINATLPGDEIWVAEGTYKPGINRNDSFRMRNNVGIYGGFSGTETARNQRNWQTNRTILSGDLADNDIRLNFEENRTDNCYHVFYHPDGSNLDSTALLDGFTISGGHTEYNGGGMVNKDSSPIITNCTFFSNYADINGAGIYNERSSPTITNCILFENSANLSSLPASYGGGIYNLNSSPIITNCTFCLNIARNGDDICNIESSPTITNSILWSGYESAIHNGTSTPIVSYCNLEQSEYVGSNGNIWQDPEFVNTYNSDFHLSNGGTPSPCINAGTNSAPNLPAKDMDGLPRIIDGTVDMGAYEHPGLKIDISVNLQGENRPESLGWQVALSVGFYPAASGTAILLNPGSAIYWFSGTTTHTITASGTRATLSVGPVNPGPYDITVDSSTSLMNVKRNVGIWYEEELPFMANEVAGYSGTSTSKQPKETTKFERYSVKAGTQSVHDPEAGSIEEAKLELRNVMLAVASCMAAPDVPISSLDGAIDDRIACITWCPAGQETVDPVPFDPALLGYLTQDVNSLITMSSSPTSGATPTWPLSYFTNTDRTDNCYCVTAEGRVIGFLSTEPHRNIAMLE